MREYTSEPVDRETLEFLVDAAIQAPSAVNQQPWSFAVVREQDVLDRISRESKRHMLGTLPALAAPDHFRQLLSCAGIDRDLGGGRKPMGSGGLLAAENLMLATHAKGLGSCWIGFAQPWLNSPAGKAALGFPAAYIPVAPIIVGWPKAAPPPVPRKTPEIRWIA